MSGLACVCVCVHTTWTQCLQRSEVGIGFPGTGVTDGWKPPCGCWEPNPRLPQERQVLLTTAPSRQPLGCIMAHLVAPLMAAQTIWKTVFGVWSSPESRHVLTPVFWCARNGDDKFVLRNMLNCASQHPTQFRCSAHIRSQMSTWLFHPCSPLPSAKLVREENSDQTVAHWALSCTKHNLVALWYLLNIYSILVALPVTNAILEIGNPLGHQ